MSKTHYKRLMNPDYIGAYALNEGEDLTVVVDYVAREVITAPAGRRKNAPLPTCADRSRSFSTAPTKRALRGSMVVH